MVGKVQMLGVLLQGSGPGTPAPEPWGLCHRSSSRARLVTPGLRRESRAEPQNTSRGRPRKESARAASLIPRVSPLADVGPARERLSGPQLPGCLGGLVESDGFLGARSPRPGQDARLVSEEDPAQLSLTRSCPFPKPGCP